MNKRSGQIGGWTIVVRQPFVDEYDYVWQGAARSGKMFNCLLVSVDTPTEYCMGQMKWTKRSENIFNSLPNKFREGHAFRMTKVAFNDDTKKQYIHTSIQTSVKLHETTFAPLLNSKEYDSCGPEPVATIAECAGLTTEQFFDVVALVKSVSAVRSGRQAHDPGRVVFDIEIMDGSKIDDQVRTMPLTVWADRPSPSSTDDPERWVFLNEALTKQEPVAFFRIKGAQDGDGKFSFTTTKNTTICTAAETTKGRSLTDDATNLLALQAVSFPVKEYELTARDFSNEQGTETMCALLASISTVPQTGVEALDKGKDTLWQLNWVRVEEPPPGSPIRTNDGKRLWFPVTVRDCTGTLTVYIQESAALALSRCADADKFVSDFGAGKMWFPQMASVKILRALKSNSAAQPAGQQNESEVHGLVDQVDLRIVEAAAQDLQESPTEESARLLPLLNANMNSTDIVMPAALYMLQKSVHYTLAVASVVPPIPDNWEASLRDVPAAAAVIRPCSQVVALVEAAEASDLQPAGDGGFKIITSNVKDLLDDSPESPGVQLTSYCSLSNLQDFNMSVPRSRANQKQAALIVISAVLRPNSFMVDSVQLLQPEEVETVKSCLKRMLYHSILAGHMTSRKRTASASWTTEESPAKGSKCRRLGRSPTATVVPEMEAASSGGA